VTNATTTTEQTMVGGWPQPSAGPQPSTGAQPPTGPQPSAGPQPSTELQPLTGPRPPAAETGQRRRVWPTALLVGALALGAAGLGVGIYSLVHTPAEVVGPIGPRGATGATGPQGIVGAQGPAGAVGPAGVAQPPVGTELVAKTACPAGQVLMGGGAQLSTSNPAGAGDVALHTSFPSDAKTWEVVAVVTATLGAGQTMSVKPYVLCGVR
jgi:hypothetical protein